MSIKKLRNTINKKYNEAEQKIFNNTKQYAEYLIEELNINKLQLLNPSTNKNYDLFINVDVILEENNLRFFITNYSDKDLDNINILFRRQMRGLPVTEDKLLNYFDKIKQEGGDGNLFEYYFSPTDWDVKIKNRIRSYL